MDSAGYETLQKGQFQRFENACRRCGECCGSRDGDPCVNLAEDASGRYSCAVYEKRLGPQKTASGRIFNCVPIRELVSRGYLRPDCAYNTARTGA